MRLSNIIIPPSIVLLRKHSGILAGAFNLQTEGFIEGFKQKGYYEVSFAESEGID